MDFSQELVSTTSKYMCLSKTRKALNLSRAILLTNPCSPMLIFWSHILFTRGRSSVFVSQCNWKSYPYAGKSPDFSALSGNDEFDLCRSPLLGLFVLPLPRLAFDPAAAESSLLISTAITAFRSNLALNKDSPEPRPVQPPRRNQTRRDLTSGGGLVHRYLRRAASPGQGSRTIQAHSEISV